MWVDAGCVRTDAWNLHSFGKRHHSLEPGVYHQLLRPLPNKEYYVHPDVYIAGSHIVFHKNYIDKYIDCYRAMMVEYMHANISLISDQYVIASMIPKHAFIHTIPVTHPVVNEWFFFFNLF